jgi:ADP-heptose:LPS heptosyltransferase
MIPERSAFAEPRKYALAIATELAAPALRGAAAVLAGRPPAAPHAWRRGLILGYNHIGDILYRTPSLPHLRRALPDCEWHYLAAPHSAEVLVGNPHVHRVHAVRRDGNRWRLGRADFGALRDQRFDVALCTSNKGHYADLALAALLGIPSRVAFAYKGMSGLITHPAPIAFPAPVPTYVRSMVAHVGGLEPDWDLTPEVFPSEIDVASAELHLREAGVGAARPVVACALTSRQTSDAMWPPAYYVAALTLASAAADFDVVLLGSAADAPLLEWAAARLPQRRAVLAGRLGLRAVVALLRRCAVVLSSDSGPRHLANAAGTPVLFVRNLYGLGIEAGSYCATDIDLTPPELQCVPRPRQAAALEAIRPELVAARLVELLTVRDPRTGRAAGPAQRSAATST